MLAEAFTEYAMDAMTDTVTGPKANSAITNKKGLRFPGGAGPRIWNIKSRRNPILRVGYRGPSFGVGSGRAAAPVAGLSGAGLGPARTLEESSPPSIWPTRSTAAKSADEASEAGVISSVRLFLLTDMACAGVRRQSRSGRSLPLCVWDLARLHRLESPAGPVNASTSTSPCSTATAIPEAPSGDPDLKSYLLIVPGQPLADLYVTYGPQLLN